MISMIKSGIQENLQVERAVRSNKNVSNKDMYYAVGYHVKSYLV